MAMASKDTSDERAAAAAAAAAAACCQGLTLVHLSAQHDIFLSLKD
jgi:hypothetical protein